MADQSRVRTPKQMFEFLRTGRPSPGLYDILGPKRKKPKPKKPPEGGPKFRTLPIKPDDKPKRKPPKKPKRPLRTSSFHQYNMRRDAIRAKGQG